MLAMSLRPARLGKALLWQTTAIGVAALFLAPLVWVVTTSLQPIGLPPPRTMSWFPHGVAWSNYREIFRIVPLAQQVGNSLFVSAIGAGLTLLTASWAGFAIAQMPPSIRRWLVSIALLLLLTPSNAIWLPRYVLFSAAGLIDTYAALVAPAVMGTKSLYVLMYYWTFRRVSTEVFESAWLDGAGVWSSWRRIALPLAGPTTLAVAMLAFSHFWSDFVDPLLFLKSAQRFTLAVGLRVLQQMDTTNWPLLLAAVVVMIAPVLLIYLALQGVVRDDAGFVRRAMRTESEEKTYE
jgi:multiple sugar transport system permease protein